QTGADAKYATTTPTAAHTATLYCVGAKRTGRTGISGGSQQRGHSVGQILSGGLSQTGRCERKAVSQNLRPCRTLSEARTIPASSTGGVCATVPFGGAGGPYQRTDSG